MNTLRKLYAEDRHFADQGLDPMRFCEANWKQLSFDWEAKKDCQLVAECVCKAIALVIASCAAFFIMLLAMLLKATTPPDHFTPREAILKNGLLLYGRSITTIIVYCDLQTGTLVAHAVAGAKYYWEPGEPDYLELTDEVVTNAGVKITRDGEMVGRDPSTLNDDTRMLDDVQVKRDVTTSFAKQSVRDVKFAPRLSVIIVQIAAMNMSQPLHYYKAPGMGSYNLLPTRSTWIPSGGRIHPDGRLDGETLQSVSLW